MIVITLSVSLFSVSEYEALLAIELDASRCKRIDRRLPSQTPISCCNQKIDTNYFDTCSDAKKQTRLDALINKLETSMENKVLNDDPNRCMTLDGYKTKDWRYHEYMESFKAYILDLFAVELSSLGRRLTEWRLSSCGLGVPGAVMDEVIHHAKVIFF